MLKRDLFTFCVIFFLVGGNCIASERSNSTSSRKVSAPTGNRRTTDTGETEPYLRFVGDFQDQRLTSGDKVQFKCRVEARPSDHMTYNWYKDRTPLTAKDNNRVSIRNKPSGTRLTIKNILSVDSGEYRCEASNGIMRIHRSATLQVSFKLPPLDGHVTKIPEGRCEIYHGKTCTSLLSGKSVYVDPFSTQDDMEKEISEALSHITNTKYVSEKCESFAYPAVCNFVFSPCHYQLDFKTGKEKAKRTKLCREDCELMKYDVCADEYLNSKNDRYLQEIFDTANCSMLPPTTSAGTKCTKIGLTPVSDAAHECYNNSGAQYKGVESVTKSGKFCQPWSSDLVIRHSELAGGHNFCRNPGTLLSMPWCYTGADSTDPEECRIKKCVSSPSKKSDIYIILIPSITIPFLFFCIAIAFCICRKRNVNKQKSGGSAKHTMGKPIDMKNLKKSKVLEINANVVQLLQEIGDGAYGKVYKARILSNPTFNPNCPVAVKTLRDGVMTKQVEEFQRELEVFSNFQHENIACLKAVVLRSSLRCIVFEYTDSVDLQEYLADRSPQSDFAKAPSRVGSHTPSSIERSDFIRMATQIVSGMEYLTSNNYIHRDLAARNVLVCGNLDLKISNLGVVKESYLSCYYRSPQGGQMLPIRWMAPESLDCWQFSDKSTVWSFGVLLWEMFSYGSHPYCGYSNHEVLEMISRRQLLPCPDHCPAKIYSLMHECWNGQPMQRPNFKDLRSKLQGWDYNGDARMTSHLLAQGIHRQTTDINNEPNEAKYNRFYQASSIGGSSGITYSSAIVPSPSPPPPQYSASFQVPASSASAYTTHHHAPPSAIPSSHLLHQSNHVFSSPAQPANQGMPLSQVSSNRQYADNYNERPQNEYVALHQSRGPIYRRGPASHSSRSSSCSSSRDYRVSHSPRRQDHGDFVAPHDKFNPTPFCGPGNRSLGGVAENEINPAGERPHLRNLYSDGSHLPHPTYTTSGGRLPLPPNPPKVESFDVSTGSAKAVSCDSGLPAEEADVNIVDVNAPLLQHPPPIIPKSSLAGGAGRVLT